MKKRVEEELEKRKDEIEAEVSRRVEAAKAQMEREMMLELETRREQARLEEQKREVNIFNEERLFGICHHTSSISNRTIDFVLFSFIIFISSRGIPLFV